MSRGGGIVEAARPYVAPLDYQQSILKESSTAASRVSGESKGGISRAFPANRLAKNAKYAGMAQTEAEQAQLSEMDKRSAEMAKNRAGIATRDAARRRQQALRGGAGNRPTLVTGPLGLTGEFTGGGKTLLGL